MGKNLHIAIAIERASEYGRRFLQGVADHYDGRPDCLLDLLDPHQVTPQATRLYDGWICRVTDRRSLKLIAATGKPVVDAICLDFNERFSTVRTDYAAIGRMAADHLTARRFPNFAFCGYRHVAFSDLRGRAFADSLASRGYQPIVYRPPYVPDARKITYLQQLQLLEGSTGEAADAQALTDWLLRLPKPVAIFCCDDFRAAAVSRLCARAGLSVPRDVAILGVDNDPIFCMFGSPRLSSIDPNATALGRAAAETLDEHIARPSAEATAKVIPPKGIIVRASTDAYPDAPDWFAEAIAFIGNNIGRGISASDVFAHIGFSRTLVERVFRRQLDRTVQAEIANARIEAAKHLLSTTSLPMKEIAYRCGYGSVEYFTRTFCTTTGRPPAGYRQNQDGAKPIG